jgi:lactobin A/cerein 7B family class IIb bacteriocin
MRELNVNEIEQVNGGIIPFLLAIIAIDAGLQATMWSSYVSRY